MRWVRVFCVIFSRQFFPLFFWFLWFLVPFNGHEISGKSRNSFKCVVIKDGRRYVEYNVCVCVFFFNLTCLNTLCVRRSMRSWACVRSLPFTCAVRPTVPLARSVCLSVPLCCARSPRRHFDKHFDKCLVGAELRARVHGATWHWFMTCTRVCVRVCTCVRVFCAVLHSFLIAAQPLFCFFQLSSPASPSVSSRSHLLLLPLLLFYLFTEPGIACGFISTHFTLFAHSFTQCSAASLSRMHSHSRSLSLCSLRLHCAPAATSFFSCCRCFRVGDEGERQLQMLATASLQLPVPVCVCVQRRGMSLWLGFFLYAQLMEYVGYYNQKGIIAT